jgi:hypothetical protein
MNANHRGLLLGAVLLPLLATTSWSQSGPMVRKERAKAGSAMASTKLHEDMRKLWTDHVVWTRVFIIGAAADLPDVPAATARLMKNQEDIGNAVAGYYGADAGRNLTALLKSHIAVAGDIVKAAKAGDQATVDQKSKAWEANVDSIATLLSGANPAWPKATLMELLKGHLSTTTDEVKARLGKNWDADVRAYDAVYDHILKLADALSEGIVKQFPDKFTMASATR